MNDYYDDVFEVPHVSDLDDYSVEVTPLAEPGGVQLRGWANDGSQVTVVWEHLIRSVWVEWRQGDVVRFALERMGATKVSVGEDRGRLEIRVWSKAPGFTGELVIEVGDGVTIRDRWQRSA